ncbi:MAG TPA: FIST N-terminal domain-containing protein [Acidiferrobacterales bacterium]
MNRFVFAHAAGRDWREASRDCLAGLAATPRDANLGFVYATDHCAEAMAEILATAQRVTGIAHWVGTVGMGICASGREYHDQPAVGMMLASFPDDGFRVFGNLRQDLDAFVDVNRPWYARTASRFGIVHGDPRNARLPDLLAALGEEVNGGFFVGGLSSSRGVHAQVADGVTEGGLSGVLLAPEVGVATTLTQGCAPFGAMHEITECERNILITLDGKPALEVFYAEIGDILARDLNRAAHYIGAALPLPGTDTGDYLVRNLVGADTDKKLLAIGELVNPGQRIQFCRRDAPSAEQDMRRMLRELKARAAQAPRGGVYYSCVGRGPNLFGAQSEELKTIQEELGEFPLVGFYCNGEISNNRLYGYTGVLTLFL